MPSRINSFPSHSTVLSGDGRSRLYMFRIASFPGFTAGFTHTQTRKCSEQVSIGHPTDHLIGHCIDHSTGILIGHSTGILLVNLLIILLAFILLEFLLLVILLVTFSTRVSGRYERQRRCSVNDLQLPQVQHS